MTAVTMRSSATCSLCRCRIRGVMVASVRIRKNDMVATRGTLSARDPKCPECGFEADSAPSRWQPDAESRARIDAVRAKRGWAEPRMVAAGADSGAEVEG